MSSRRLVSPPPKRSKTEDGEELENYVHLDLIGTADVDLNRAKNEKGNAKNQPPSEFLRDDGEQRSELAPLEQKIVVTDVVTLADCVPEVWKDIFDTLDSGDLLTCFRTSSKWRNLLGPKRTQLLFPEVASLLFPPNDPTLLECRKVCKSWKEDVDSQVHRSMVLLPFEKDAANGSYTIMLETIERIRQFLVEMGSHPENPFPWRSIMIGWNSSGQWRFGALGSEEKNAYLSEFLINLIQLLDVYGQYIYYVTFDLYLYEWRLGNPDLLREVLLRVPNLRRLAITIDNGYSVEREPVEAYYAANPLPQSVHLETLKLENLENDAVPILCSCIAPQSIKRMDTICFYEGLYYFPNLEVFKGWIHLEDLERFQNAAQQLRLKKLVIDVTMQDVERVMDFQQVFTSLAPFAESLKYLRVRSCALRSLTLRDNDFRINFPKLKYLRLENFDGSLDMLVELSSLRDLDVEFSLEMWDGTTITVLGRQKQISDSNIWELIPTLENLIVRVLYDEVEPRKYKRNFSNGIVVKVEGYKFDSYASDEDEESGSNEEHESENDSQEDRDDEGDE